MLKRLVIKNYALIDSMELDFDPGFTVITGETGAGKSIMLGALSLLTGTRAATSMAGDAKAYVEAWFTGVDSELKSLFESYGIEWIDDCSDKGGEVTVRREISGKGRSRIFINDTPVTLTTLSEIGGRLLDIHSQHGTAKLSDKTEQMKVIDMIAGNEEIMERYRREFRIVVSLKKRIDEVKSRIEESRRNEEMLRFRFEQLDKLKPRRGELSEIERRYEILSDAGDIKERLVKLCGLLGDSEYGILGKLSEAKSLLGHIDIGLFGNELEEGGLEERLQAVNEEINDIYETIEDMNAAVDTDPTSLERLSSRMQAYYDAERRFKVTDADSLASIYEDLRRQLGELHGEGEELPQLEKEARKHMADLRAIADELSESRKAGARIFSEKIQEATSGLGLNNLRFEVRMSESRISSTGKDLVEFYCAFNKNGEMRRLGETASGGEMSRLMLGLKSVVAAHMELPTVIFDEIDTGVSGDIADRMGRMMHDMGTEIQVIAITHLPQVAARGDAHFKVFKRDEAERTVTYAEKLENDTRINEIAAMISGREVTEAAVKAASALMNPSGQ